MKFIIIDDTTIRIVASSEEEQKYSTHDTIYIDSCDTFTCISEPSTISDSWKITRNPGESLFNKNLSLLNAPFKTDTFMIVYIRLADATFPIVAPCYDNRKLLELVANKSGVYDSSCDCINNKDKAKYIVEYYGFKLACSILELNKAIKFWKRLNGITNNISNCNCNG